MGGLSSTQASQMSGICVWEREQEISGTISLFCQSPTHKRQQRQQMDLIAELKKKQMVKEPLIYEEKDGAIEDIITGEETTLVYQWTLKSLQIFCRKQVGAS